MLVFEIALGIVLALLIILYLPQSLNFAVNTFVLLLLLGAVASVIVFVIAFPQFSYIVAIVIGVPAYYFLADHASRYLQKNSDRLPSWVKALLTDTKQINWTLALFSGLLALLVSIAVLVSAAWAWESAKHLGTFPTWASGTLLCIVLPVATCLIYRLPWPVKVALKNSRSR